MFVVLGDCVIAADCPSLLSFCVQYWRQFNPLHTVSLLLIASVEWCEEACELLSSLHSNYHSHLNQQSDAASHVKRARPTNRSRARAAREADNGSYPLHFSGPGEITAVSDSSTVTIPVSELSLAPSAQHRALHVVCSYVFCVACGRLTVCRVSVCVLCAVRAVGVAAG